MSPPRAAWSSPISLSSWRRRTVIWRRTGSGFADGCFPSNAESSPLSSVAFRYRSYRSRAASRSALIRSAWRAFSSSERRSARAASTWPRSSRARTSASRSCSSMREVLLALGHGGLRPYHGRLRHAQATGVLVPLGVEIVERPIQLPAGGARAPVRSADRRLEPVAERPLVAGQVADLVVADRGGRAEELLAGDAGQLGEHLVRPRRIADGLAVEDQPDGPADTAEVLLEGSAAGAVLVVLDEVQRDPWARFGPTVPGPQRVDLRPRGRHPPEQGQLDRPLQGGLAGLVGPPDDGQPRGELQVQLAVDAEVADANAADPHSVTSWPSRSRRASRRASRSSAGSAVG